MAATLDDVLSELKSQKKMSSTGLGGVDSAVNAAAQKLNPFTQATKLAGEGLGALYDASKAGLESFRDLSKVGAGFNNDIIGMTVAAAGTRLPLGEFADVVKKNSENLVGLGGNATRGAEAFAKMSKEFFDSGFADGLRNVGYTNKELNDVLALQAGFIRTSMREDKAGRESALQSAAALATEMDLMSKLTGKSREQQMEAMKQAQTDQQVQAKLRLLTAGKSEEEAQKIRENFAKQYNDAQLRGQGQMFKEIFATGTVISKEAGTQAALYQEQAAATRKQALATQIGDEKAASAAGAEARAQMVKDLNDTSKNQIMTLGSATGVVGDTMMKTASAQQSYAEGLQKTAKQHNIDISTKEGMMAAEKKMREEAEKSAAGKDKEGKSVDGATKAMIQFGGRLDDTRAALTKSLLEPLNKEIGPGLGKFASTYLSGNNFGGTGKRTAQAIEEAVGTGVGKVGTAPPTTGDRRTAPVATPRTGMAGTALDVAETAGVGYGGLLKGAKASIDKLNEMGAPKSRATGSLGETGKLFEDWGAGSLAMLHGKEAVINEEQMKKMAAGFQQGGMKETMDSMMKSMPKIDMDKMSKDINTSVSSVTKQMPGMADMQKSMPKVDFDKNKFKMPSFDQFNFGKGGDFNIAPKTVEAVTPKPTEIKQPTPVKTETKTEVKPSSTSTESISTEGAMLQKAATLDDVIKALNSLNTTMNKIAQTNNETNSLVNKQIRATKSIGGNLYDRA